ncbi:MAG: TetR family transcriptional regulator [Gemmatimonadetes bacterium]|nr:TetR family transcriptional regulator [Gemmatimonadota bacterium]
MGQLTAPRRARSAEAKADRARALEDAALAALERVAWPDLAVAQVARDAGVAKGTLYLYFPTKESLGLALVGRLLGRWFDDVIASLDLARAPLSPHAAAERIVATVERHRTLLPLLAISGTLLEANVAADAARGFKAELLRRTLEGGAALERAMGTLRPGEGARLFLHLHALVTGLYRMAEPAPVVRAVLRTPRFRALRVEFTTELTFAFTALLVGVVAQRDRLPASRS